jgi:hypothetical protein
MSLADSEFVIRFDDGEPITLRPTLRAAMRLERRFDGFNNLLRGIAEQNISAMAEIIRETSRDAWRLIGFLEAHADTPLCVRITPLTEPLLSLTLALAGLDPEDVGKEGDNVKASDRVSFAEHHKRLFKLATGWLGWTPEQTWNATPAEIRAAYEGRLDMLKAIFGDGKDRGQEKTPKRSGAEFVAFLSGKVKRKPKVKA